MVVPERGGSLIETNAESKSTGENGCDKDAVASGDGVVESVGEL